MFPGLGFEPTLTRPNLQGNALTNCATLTKVSVGKKIIIMYCNIYHCSLTQQQILMTS